jgi:hypothetical protein
VRWAGAAERGDVVLNTDSAQVWRARGVAERGDVVLNTDSPEVWRARLAPGIVFEEDGHVPPPW